MSPVSILQCQLFNFLYSKFLIFFFSCDHPLKNQQKMRIFSFAALAIGAYGQSVMLDENTPCSDFAAVFGSFPNMKTKCRGKSNKKKTKQFCNLICENGQQNVWSTRPIKVCDFFLFSKKKYFFNKFNNIFRLVQSKEIWC